MLKTDRDLKFLKDDRFSLGNVNMAKIYERLLSTNILREKRRHSSYPERVTLLEEDSICMVNLLQTPRVIVFFFLLHKWLALVVSEEKFCFVKQA